MKNILISLLLLSIPLTSQATAQDIYEQGPAQLPPELQPAIVVASQDPLLASVDSTGREYLRVPVADKLSYWHQRTIDGAIVEGDHIRYTLNAETGELEDWSIEWRDLLTPEPPRVSREAAQAAVYGEVLFSRLYILAPGSSVYPIKPTPENPCWVIRHIYDDALFVSIYDAVTGQFLGHGVPPPAPGLATHGPDWGSCPQSPIWYDWANNAKTWFDAMGYTTDRIGNSSETDLRNHLQSDSGIVFYELNHGGSTSWHNRCDQDITAVEVGSWIVNHASLPFAFIGSCEGLCNTGDNNFAWEFRKGLPLDSVVVGYCHMDATYCNTCWDNSINWQNALFDWLDRGYSAQASFNHANAAWPTCAGTNQCMRIAGDTAMRLVPNVGRSLCGTLNWPLAPYLFHLQPWGDRAHHIRCNLSSAGAGLTIYPNVEMVFLNDSALIAAQPISANASTGSIIFVSEQDRNRGMEINVGGQMRMYNNGQIKVYE